MTTTTPIYGTQAQNAPTGQVNVFDPNTGKALTGAGAFNPNTGQAITSEQLKPVVPIGLPDTTPTPTYGGIPGATEALANQSVADTKATESQTAADVANKALVDSILGQTNDTSVDYTAQDAAKKEKDRLDAAQLSEQQSNRRAIEFLQKNNPGGTFGGALAQQIDVQNRKSLSTQADIAIQQFVANNDYQGAVAIADRQVAMNMEQSRIKIQALQTVADNASTIADRDFQVSLNEKIKTEQRAYDKQKTAEDAISTLKLNVAKYAGNDKSSLLTQLSAIDTTKPGAYDKAVTIAGKYSEDPLDRELKRANIASANRANQPSAKLTKVTVNGVDYMQDEAGKLTTPVIPAGTNTDMPMLLAQGSNDIKTIADLQLDKVSVRASAGTYTHDRPFGLPFSMRIQNWQAEVGNVLAKLTLAELARVKGQGVTFGALSEGERQAVAASASVLNNAKIMKGTGENAVWTGNFNISENLVKEKLAEIQSYAEIDFKKKTGISYQDYVSGASVDSYLNMVDGALQVTNNPYMQAGYNTQ